MPVKSLLSQVDAAVLAKAIDGELYAAHLYRHVANQLQRLGYFGAQKFFLAESADETAHYQKIADFMNDRGDVARLPQIPAIDEKITGLRDAIESAYDTELQLCEDYEAGYRRCTSLITQQFLLQFLEGQRKAVGEYGDLLARLDRAGADAAAILIIDKELGE